jgi:hypothetical protein
VAHERGLAGTQRPVQFDRQAERRLGRLWCLRFWP